MASISPIGSQLPARRRGLISGPRLTTRFDRRLAKILVHATKVLSHEDDVLKNEFGSEIAAIKREYYRICMEFLDNYKRTRGLEFSSRTAVLSLFGMMNWIYTWYNPRVDANAKEMAREMGDIFLQGIGASAANGSRKRKFVFSS